MEKSELIHKEFEVERGVSLATLQFWICKLRRESRLESPPVILPVELVRSTALSARQPAAEVPCATVEAVLPSGLVLRIPVGADLAHVRELVTALG